MPLQEQWWNFCTIRIKANENSLEVVDEALADEFLLGEQVGSLSRYFKITVFSHPQRKKIEQCFPIQKGFSIL